MAPGPALSVLAHEVEHTNQSPCPNKVIEKNSQKSSSHGTSVLEPSLITTEFDLLRFDAAAFSQLDTQNNKAIPQLSTHLISSPYNNPGHYLDLSTLSAPHRIFAKALTALKPILPDYATAPYTTSLNFNSVLDLIRKFSANEGFQWKEQSFYVVIFRSKLKEGVDNELLYKLDSESHREACESGGLLKYWFGKPDGERRNLATCIWRSREDARKGGLGPWHKKARAAGRELYESIGFSAHRFAILDGATGFKFEDWED